jgi:molybdenum cofactor synthesis domain-containing protein
MILRIGILTVSDRAASGQRVDTSGPTLAEAVRALGWIVQQMEVVPDEREAIEKTLITWSDEGNLQVILTTGGTGFSPRDVTPEATQAIIERMAPGLAEAMRQSSLAVTPHAMLSRALAGIRKRTLIVNLPGSPKAALENFQVIQPVLPHAAQLLTEDPQAEGDHHRLG